MFQTPDQVILQNSGLDAFFFLRYLQTVFKIFISLLFVVVTSLVPVNFTGGNTSSNIRGLDKFGWANIGSNRTQLYWTHLIMALIVIIFICHTIFEELSFYVKVHNAFLTYPAHRLLESTNTILITDIPKKETLILKEVCGMFPGGVRSMWTNRDLSTLLKKIQKRKKLVTMLEVAETKLLRKAITSSHRQKNLTMELREVRSKRKGPLWNQYLDEKDRDHIFLPLNGWTRIVPFIGKRVDLIDHCLKQLARIEMDIEADQQELVDMELDHRDSTKYPRTRSAFIQFNTQIAAHMACQTLLHSSPFHILVQHVDASFCEIQWNSLSQTWRIRYARTGLIWIIMALLLLFWAIPVAFTGFLSQVTTLADSVPWLQWISDMPAWVSGSVQGVLPQLILSILTMVLPLILHALTEWQGLITDTAIELSLQKYYFSFLFVQNFLTVSLSSSITGIAQDIVNGQDSIPILLANNLPKASNYFFSYLILEGLSVSAGTLLQAGTLMKWFIFVPWMDHTPREKRDRQRNLPQIQIGTLFPFFSNLACIGKVLTVFLRNSADDVGLTYSIIAPLVIVFSAMAFGLFWFVFRYNLLYVSAFPHDTRGQLYPTALKQLFVGVYMLELCLTGLFLSIRDDRGVPTGIGQAVIMMFTTVVTVAYQLLLRNIFSSTLQHLPAFMDYENGEDDRFKHQYSLLDLLSSWYQFVNSWATNAAENPSKKISRTFQESIQKLAHNQFTKSNKHGYNHEAIHDHDNTVWIPKDHLGISEDEISNARNVFPGIKISSELAEFDEKGEVKILSNIY